ncbi:MAG: DUF6816 family protein [Microcoleaceae cyanobacterium]
MRRITIIIFIIILNFFSYESLVLAENLSDRISAFPNWNSKPTVEVAKGDLIYPDWMQGDWQATSTLVDLVAPLAPDIITPGFEGNRQFINQPIEFKVRFQPVEKYRAISTSSPLPIVNSESVIVADRAFNGLNIGRATLGKSAILSVKTDKDNPNRQITELPGNRQLLSIVTARNSEIPKLNQFISTEICQQIFNGETSIYLNEVETTTFYTRNIDKNSGKTTSVNADQITAIYLSPRDPNYFKAKDRPVSLYRYQLQLLHL